jgi:outer membrane protein, multidrug efflux system
MFRPTTLWPTATLALATLSITGCMVGPKYHQPTPPVPTQFKEGGTPDSGTPDIAYSDWWRVFKDPELARLETEADGANQDIKLAVARVEQAEAGARYARSFLFPTISIGAAASRTREAQNRPNNGINGNTNGKPATYNDFQFPAFLSYEVDAWGRVRSSLQAANATRQASAADLRFVCLAVEANVAMDYYSLREIDAERDVLDATVRDMQSAVDLTTNRFRGGLSSELEVKQAETLLNQTQAQAQALDVQRAQLEHAIAVLEGKAASDFSIPRTPLNGLPPVIPSGLPSELLARRPDIAEVERLVAASNAEIGVAKTAALPHISLTGLAGFESTSMASLFSWQNGIASLAASAITPLFTGGRTKAGVDEAWAVYRQSLAQYQKTVLVAYQEVEDQLAALRILTGEAQSTADAVTNAQQAETIALNRCRSGLVSYLDVIYAQTALLANQRTATQISGQRMVATVVLIKALGGGWLGVPTEPGTNPSSAAPIAGTNATGQSALTAEVAK